MFIETYGDSPLITVALVLATIVGLLCIGKYFISLCIWIAKTCNYIARKAQREIHERPFPGRQRPHPQYRWLNPDEVERFSTMKWSTSIHDSTWVKEIPDYPPKIGDLFILVFVFKDKTGKRVAYNGTHPIDYRIAIEMLNSGQYYIVDLRMLPDVYLHRCFKREPAPNFRREEDGEAER